MMQSIRIININKISIFLVYITINNLVDDEMIIIKVYLIVLASIKTDYI